MTFLQMKKTNSAGDNCFCYRSNRALRAFRFKQQHERSLELCLQKQMEQCMKECDLKAPIATPCLKLLVAEVTPYEDPEKTPMEMEVF